MILRIDIRFGTWLRLNRPRLRLGHQTWLSRPRPIWGHGSGHTRGRVCDTVSPLLAMLLLGWTATSAPAQRPGAAGPDSTKPAAATKPTPSDQASAADAPLPAELAELDAPRIVRLGNERLLKGDPESALQAYERAKSLVPDAREIDFVEGLAEYARGDYERARTWFENAATASDPKLVDDAVYSVAATYHQQALHNTDDPKAKIAALEQAMNHYQTVLAHQPDHEAARDANFKAATAWRQLKRQMQQQQNQQPQDDNDKKDQKEDQDQSQQDQQQQDDQDKQDQQNKDQDQQQSQQQQQQDQDQQNSDADPSEQQASPEDKDQPEDKQQAQQRKEDVSKEQAERQLREMMQAIRDRKKKQRKQQGRVEIVPVDKDW